MHWEHSLCAAFWRFVGAGLSLLLLRAGWIGLAGLRLVQPIRYVFKGALHCGDEALHRFQLLRGGVDGGVLGHDVTVIIPERPDGPLTDRKDSSEFKQADESY